VACAISTALAMDGGIGRPGVIADVMPSGFSWMMMPQAAG